MEIFQRYTFKTYAKTYSEKCNLMLTLFLIILPIMLAELCSSFRPKQDSKSDA